MQIEDILYSLDRRNVPGKASLVSVREMFFNSGDVASTGADIFVDLPRPPAGFARKWSFVAVIVTTPGLATADILRLWWQDKDSSFGSTVEIATITGQTATDGGPMPLIGGRRLNGQGNVQHGINPFWVGAEDNLRVYIHLNAPVAQVMNVRGLFKDIPI